MTNEPLPKLRVAITGHRDLDPSGLEQVRRTLAEVLVTLRERVGPATIEVTTGMADGADQLAVAVAEELGLAVRAVLPKPLAEYRNELSPAGRDGLDELLSDQTQPVGVVASSAPGLGDDDAAPYLNLGRFLARDSHVVIALWDGGSERKPGGTLDVLARFVDRSYSADIDNDPPRTIEPRDGAAQNTGPVGVWIPAARVDGPSMAASTPRFVIGTGVRGVWRTTDSMPTELLELLGGTAETARITRASKPLENAYALLDDLPAGLSSDERASLSAVHESYLAADGFAGHYQKRSDRSSIGAALIAGSMGFAFLWFAKIDDNLFWLYAYLALFALGYVAYRLARDRHWLRRHLAFRATAETLRVEFFARLLGIADQLDAREIMDQTGVSGFRGFGWAREAARTGSPLVLDRPPQVVTHSDLVSSAWVDDQARYFGRRTHLLHRRHARLELVQRLLYVLSLVAVVVVILFGDELKKQYAPGHVSAKTIVIFLMGLLPLWLTLWELHQDRMATKELHWQYRNQAELFAHASLALRDPGTDVDLAEVYLKLAERSLFETYLWTIHRYHREFAPPSGG